MGLMDWLNSFLGKKEEDDIKLEPDGVKEFEDNEELQSNIREPLEEPKEIVIDDIKPVKAAKSKAKPKSRKKGRR